MSADPYIDPIGIALAGIPLSALSDRLQAVALSAAPAPEAASPSGELVLFE